MTCSSWNILLHRTQIDNLIHSHFTSQRLSYMYKTVNWSFRVLRCHSLSHKKHISWVLIQFLSKKSETNNYLFYLIHCQYPENLVFRFNCDKSTFESRALCVFVSERERERDGESKDAITVSLFWISGSLPRDRIATVHCSSLGVGLRDQTLQTVHMDVCSS